MSNDKVRDVVTQQGRVEAAMAKAIQRSQMEALINAPIWGTGVRLNLGEVERLRFYGEKTPKKPLPQLTRTAVTVVEDMSRDLAEEAEDVLGYKVLGEEVASNDLKRHLAELEIEPFDQEKVDEYKQVMAGNASSSFTRAAWRLTPIAQYTQPIPLHVLHRAVAIKKGVPECEVLVNHLVHTAVPDPFLVVKMGAHVFYVDVWDEPKWESSK